MPRGVKKTKKVGREPEATPKVAPKVEAKAPEVSVNKLCGDNDCGHVNAIHNQRGCNTQGCLCPSFQ